MSETVRQAAERNYYRGVRACIAWLHAEALKMNDPHARSILDNAAFHLGVDKPPPAESSAGSPSAASACTLATDEPSNPQGDAS